MSRNTDIIFLVSLVNQLVNYKEKYEFWRKDLRSNLHYKRSTSPLLNKSVACFRHFWYRPEPQFNDFYERVRINVIYELFTQIIDTIVGVEPAL